MSNPYTGQVSAFAFPYAPAYWAFCDGSNVPINQYGALYSLLGNVFGGSGGTTFGLPNLGAAAACGSGQGPGLSNRFLGQTFGTASVTLDQTTMPAHTHTGEAVSGARGIFPSITPTASSGITVSNGLSLYSDGAANAIMSPNACSVTGGNAAHNNQQPYLGLNYCIALMGQYPDFG